MLTNTVETRYPPQSILQRISNHVQVHGIQSLWKNNLTNCIRVFPYAAVQFASYEYYKAFVFVNVTQRHNREFGGLERILFGIMTGATAVISYVMLMYKYSCSLI